MSEEAADAIADYCKDEGITITAWMEAVGLRLASLQSTGIEDPNLRPAADGTAQLAREIDAKRRVRSKRPAE